MKRPTWTLREHQERRMQAALVATRRRAGMGPVRRSRRQVLNIKLEGNLDLIQNEHHTREQLEQFNAIVRAPKGRRQLSVFVHMRQVTEIDPCALLHLVAQVERIQQRVGARISGSYPRDDRALVALAEAGFDEFMGMGRKRLPTRYRLGHLQLTRHSCASPLHPQDWLHLHVFLRENAGLSKQQRDVVYNAFGECVENVRQHAFKVRASGTWYALAIRPMPDRPARAVVLDLGVGIARSVRKTGVDKVRNFVAQTMLALLRKLADEDELQLVERWAKSIGVDDFACAYLATLGLRTQTKDARRGTGLSGLRESTQENAAIRLHVLTGRARVTWEQGHEPIDIPQPPIQGTLVCLELAGGGGPHGT